MGFEWIKRQQLKPTCSKITPMMTFIFTFLFFLLVVAAMAVGVIFSNKPIKGSCGGMGALGLDTSCDLCGGNPQVCEENTRSANSSANSSANVIGEDRGDDSGVKLYAPADTNP